MKNIGDLCIYPAIIGLLYLYRFEGIEEAGSIAIFLIWFFIIIGALCLFTDPEQLFKTSRARKAKALMMGILVVFMVAIGWTATASIYLGVWFILQGKYLSYKESLKSESEAAE